MSPRLPKYYNCVSNYFSKRIDRNKESSITSSSTDSCVCYKSSTEDVYIYTMTCPYNCSDGTISEIKTEHNHNANGICKTTITECGTTKLTIVSEPDGNNTYTVTTTYYDGTTTTITTYTESNYHGIMPTLYCEEE